jgi:hypothetical protein
MILLQEDERLKEFPSKSNEFKMNFGEETKARS